VEIVMVSKTITIDVNDLIKIDKKVKNREINSVSEFIQNAIQKELDNAK